MNPLCRGIGFAVLLATPFWLAVAWGLTQVDVVSVADHIVAIAWYGRWPYGVIGLILTVACLADVHLNPSQEEQS